MKLRRRHIQPLLLALIFLFAAACQRQAAQARPKNVILCIGDGMGPEHVKAGGMFVHGKPGALLFESLPSKGSATTFSANALITDSAAAATAMATGTKVNNGVLSMALPGGGGELPTLLEIFEKAGKSAGLVTTKNITDATPAAFGAHEPGRGNLKEVAGDYLTQTKPNVLFGGGGLGMTESAAASAGYAVVKNAAELKALDTEKAVYVSGQFGAGIMPYESDGIGDLPHLSQMAQTALAILDNDPDGFFLMIEGGKIDQAAHANETERCMGEMAEFENAVEVARKWAASRGDTLLLVTADHETGGLKVLKNKGKGAAPEVAWGTKGHTATNVGVYATGPGAGKVSGTIDDTDIFWICQGAPVPAKRPVAQPQESRVLAGRAASSD